jgi:hypothetical protein
MAEGTITRKDIITDDALRWGDEYAKTLNDAIAKNREFVDSIILLNAENVKLRRSENQTEFIKQKNEVKLLAEQSIVTLKEQQVAETNLEKVKQEALKTEKLALEVANKKQAASKVSIKLSVEERLANEQNNRLAKEQAILSSKMTSAYTKLNLQRTIAKKTLLDLLSAENQNVEAIKKAQREFEMLDVRVRLADRAVGDFHKSVGNYPKITNLTNALRDLVGAFGLVGGVALFGTVMTDIFNIVKDFDRQLIAVGKTTNITGDDLKQFGNEVIDLGDKLDGITVDGLIQSAEVAGQLGVTGTSNILKFSEAIEKLKLTSNIISEEQVGQFAKFIEVSSDSFENADKLASVITQLGNSFATTEAEVLANATEIQKGVAVYKTSAQGVLALGAATSTLGSEAESSRSAIQSTFAVINNAIATGKNLEKVLKLTGLTQKELSKQFNEDATGVFQKFIKGLSDAKNSGENLALVLNDVEITEKRAFTVIGSLAANYGILEGAMAQANKEYIENAALNKEVAAASESISSIIADLRDKWEAYVLQTNSANSGTEALTKTLKFLRDNFKEIINFVLKAGAVLITYLGVVKAVNFVMATSTALQTAWTAGQIRFALSTGIGTQSILAQAAAARTATVAQEGLNVAVKATPWGLIIGLLLATTTAYAVFNDEMSKSEKNIQNIIDANKRLQDSEKSYAGDRDKSRNEDFKGIEQEIELRKAKGENSDKLDKEEIARKNEILDAQIKVYSDLKNVELKRTETEISNSRQRIVQMEIEQKALEKSGYRVSKSGKTGDELTELIANEKVKLNIKKAGFSENSKLTIEEQTRLAKLKEDLNNDAAIKDAASKTEEDKKAKSAREKAAKDAIDRAKKLSDSEYELKKQQLERIIKINEDVAKDNEQTDEIRIAALEVSNKKQIALAELTKKHSLDADKFVTAENKLNANQKIIIANEAANKIVDINKKTAEEIDKIKLFDSKEYELELKRGTDFLTIANENAIAEEEKRFQAELALGYANDKAKQDAAEEHEKKLFDIKKSGLIALTRLQINALTDELNAYEAQSDGSQKSQDFILEKRAKVAELSARLTEKEGEVFKENETEKADTAAQRLANWYSENEKTINDIAQISSESLAQLSDLANAFTERKIQNLDDEINKNNEYYDKQIELAGKDERQKDLLQKERDKKNAVLEKKKKEAQHKQAVYDKAVSVAQIAIATALAIIKAAPNWVNMGLAAVAGAIALATAIATPIPKYKMGRKGGPAETAWVGDGGVSEVITSSRGLNPRLTPNIPTLTHLNEGDIVHKSIADYQAYMRASILSGFKMDGHKMNEFQMKQNNGNNQELIDEMRLSRKVFEKFKTNVNVNVPSMDINHHLWKMRNTNWS